VLYMKAGASVSDAVHEAAEDMRALKGGLISRVTIHAIDRNGGHKVVAVNGSRDNKYWIWEGQGTPRLESAEPITISDSQPRPTTTTRYTARRR
jgi:L-asparaginase / beta-aspartyl-peptidase